MDEENDEIPCTFSQTHSLDITGHNPFQRLLLALVIQNVTVLDFLPDTNHHPFTVEEGFHPGMY